MNIGINKIFIYTFIFFLFLIKSYGQETKKTIREGTVSYVSTQNIYLKFSSTEGIAVGDTLYKREGNNFAPALVVKYLSSTSCAGPSVSENKIEKGENLVAFVSKNETPVQDNFVSQDKTNSEEVYTNNEVFAPSSPASNIRGRVTAASYSTLSNTERPSDQRWRYLVSLQGNNIYNGPFSFDTYISFRYRNSDWSRVKNNLGNALKVYSFSMSYNFTKDTKLTFGRNYNRSVSNLGVSDGIQFESSWNDFQSGIIIGSRPNLYDYGYNLKLFQFGGYISRADTFQNGLMQNTLAFIQQTNDFKIDRRFIYVQHNNSSIKNVNMFISSEFDLYKRENGKALNKFGLTSFYASINYRPANWLSINTSYDNRKNVIYYETYKTLADSILDSSTRQGIRVRANFRFIRGVSFYGNYGYRFREGDVNKTNNFGLGSSVSRVPFLRSSLSLNYTEFNNVYSKGKIISSRLNKDIIPGILNANLGYRWLKYDFSSSQGFSQNIITLDLNTNLNRVIYLTFNYEGIFQNKTTYSRLVLNFTTRF